MPPKCNIHTREEDCNIFSMAKRKMVPEGILTQVWMMEDTLTFNQSLCTYLLKQPISVFSGTVLFQNSTVNQFQARAVIPICNSF